MLENIQVRSLLLLAERSRCDVLRTVKHLKREGSNVNTRRLHANSIAIKLTVCVSNTRLIRLSASCPSTKFTCLFSEGSDSEAITPEEFIVREPQTYPLPSLLSNRWRDKTHGLDTQHKIRREEEKKRRKGLSEIVLDERVQLPISFLFLFYFGDEEAKCSESCTCCVTFYTVSLPVSTA